MTDAPVPPARRRHTVGIEQRRQLLQRLLVDAALEIDHLSERIPVSHPAPSIELGFSGMIETKIALFALDPQQEPDLLLTDADRPAAAADEALRQPIAQPAAGGAEDADLLFAQTDFFLQLPIHGLQRGLVGTNAALRELPGILANAPPPEQLTLIIAENDADVWPENRPGRSRSRTSLSFPAFFHILWWEQIHGNFSLC
jgi:hypothetical protein